MGATRSSREAEPASRPAERSGRGRGAYLLQAWGAALGLGLFGLLPLDRASALGGAIARLIGPHLPVSRRARRNLRRVMPALSEPEIERVVRGMWDNLGRVVAEYPHLRQLRQSAPGARVETIGLEHIHRAVADGKRIIFVGGHLANWEITAVAAAQHGIPAAFVYRAANNPRVDRMIARLRGEASTFVPKGRTAARQAIDLLRQGRHLGLLADQKMNDGIAVPFFGRPAMTPSAPATLALRFDCAVLPTRVERLAGARFRLTLFPPLELPRGGDPHEDVARLTATINAVLESWIRDAPEQWFWLHRRWPD